MHAIRQVAALMAAGVLMAAGASARNWTPGDVGSSVKLWLNVADTGTLYQDASGATPVTANGQTVLRWNDKSGNTNDLTSDNGPSYTTSIMNGNAVLAFDKDTLVRTSGLTMGNIGDNFAVIGVFKVVTNSVNWDAWIAWGVGSTVGDPVLFITGAARPTGPAQAMEFAYNGGTGEATDSPVTGQPAFMYVGVLNQTANPHLFSAWKDGVTNGTSAPSGITYPSAALTAFEIGNVNSTRNPSGNIAELLLVNTGTADTLPILTRQRLEGYLAHKWWGAGAANPLPSDHPYKTFPPQVVWSNPSASVTGPTSASATATLLNGIVGGPNASVTLFWDTEDRGTSGWTHSNGPAIKTVGQVSMDITGLSPYASRTNYYRFYTTNVALDADGWSPVASFTTAVSSTCWRPTQGEMGGSVKLWLDAADVSTLYRDASGTTPVTANGQTVLRWNDNSGNGNDLTSANGPTYATGVMNDNAVLTFDKDNLERTSGVAMGNIGDNFAVIGVFKVVTNSVYWDLWIEWGVGNGVSGDPVMFVTGAAWANGPAQAMAFAYCNGSGMTTISPVTGEPAFIFAGVLDQASSPRQFSIWRDGATNGTYTGSGGPSAALSAFQIGYNDTTRNPSGNIAELLLVNTGTANTLPIVTRQKLEGYLAHKWWGAGAANPLPSDHPYKWSPPPATPSGIVLKFF